MWEHRIITHPSKQLLGGLSISSLCWSTLYPTTKPNRAVTTTLVDLVNDSNLYQCIGYYHVLAIHNLHEFIWYSNIWLVWYQFISIVAWDQFLSTIGIQLNQSSASVLLPLCCFSRVSPCGSAVAIMELVVRYRKGTSTVLFVGLGSLAYKSTSLLFGGPFLKKSLPDHTTHGQREVEVDNQSKLYGLFILNTSTLSTKKTSKWHRLRQFHPGSPQTHQPSAIISSFSAAAHFTATTAVGTSLCLSSCGSSAFAIRLSLAKT